MKIYIWYPVLVSMGLGFTFMCIPPLNPQFMALLGVSYDGLAWLLSGLFWTHSLMQLPAGLISDRYSPWRVLVAGLVIALAANILPFINPHSLILATSLRFVLGVGTSLAFLALIKVMITLAPADKVVAIQGFQGAGFSFGFVLPYLILPHLGEEAWPYSYLVSVAFLLAALVAAFFLPRAALQAPPAGRPAGELKGAAFKILTSRPIWFLGIFHGLSYGSLSNLGSWLPSILADLDGRGDPRAWATAAVALLLLGTAGRAFGGQLLAWVSRDRLVNGAVLLICLLYIVLGLAGGAGLALAAALLMALACGSTYGGIFTLAASAGGGYAATAMGVMNMIGNLFNMGLILVLGHVREHTGQFSPGLLAAGLLGLTCWLAGRRFITLAGKQK
ncbi:MAG: MFS transporter [Candidatus Adiutrix sp.]|jgi:NNP family nitrate/nitrite transporter-like MFS transporter|nr:MFS transporter [Candidatus Adiutrix sp.]